MHRDSHAQPFANLARAFARNFDELKSGRTAHRPRFKKKGRCPDSFYVANDKFRLAGRHAVLPRIGRVALRESLRFDGKIMGATVQREAGHWYLSVQVDLPEASAQRKRSAHGVVGVDLGISAAATLSTNRWLRHAHSNAACAGFASAGKSRLSETNTVNKTVRGRK